MGQINRQIMKRFAANTMAIALLTLGSHYEASGQSPPVAAQPQLVVATFNINYANLNLLHVVKQIRESKADLVFLQETTGRSERFLQRTLGTLYPTIKFAGGDGRYLQTDSESFRVSRSATSSLLLPPKDCLAYSAAMLDGKKPTSSGSMCTCLHLRYEKIRDSQGC